MDREVRPPWGRLDEDTKRDLKGIVGKEAYSDALMDRVSYAYDASDHVRRPDAAVWPENREQVSRILRLAAERVFPVIPRGAGTGLAGGAVPATGGLVLDLCRMNRIREVRIADRLVVLEPGVVYEDLQRVLHPLGFFFPPDPASGKVCTIGGNVATNAGGMRGAKYGVTRDYVLGLEVVLPGGEILRTGSRCMKSSSGYFVTGLFVGSEGTLGVITEITLRIRPVPRARETATALFARLEDAGRSVAGIVASGVIPSVLEILDRRSLDVLRRQASMAIPPAEALLLAETDGYTPEEAGYQMGLVEACLRGNGALTIERARGEEGADRLWEARRRLGSAAAGLRPHNLSEDVTIPLSGLPDFLAALSRVIEASGLPFVVFGHAGDGNLHPKIFFDRRNPEERKRAEEAVAEIFRLTCAAQGTLSGEHGIGLAKAPYMGLEHAPGTLRLMAGIKRLLDPLGILNPGKILPEGAPGALSGPGASSLSP